MPQVKPTDVAMTNSTTGSIARVHHSEPNITLMGRIAADPVGKIGKYGPGGKPDLHFTVIVDDLYSGIFGFDGQPIKNLDGYKTQPIGTPGGTLGAFVLIQSNFYRNVLPEGVIVKIDISPPAGMSRTRLAQELIRNAHNFASFTLPYSAPRKFVGEVMVEGEYNSSSYIAGLLQSVMGHVPEISIPGYQAPGWDSPIPAAYFKGEAFR